MGIPVGCYHYSYADSVDDAKREAKFCLENIGNMKLEYPVIIDVEDKEKIGIDVYFEKENIYTLDSKGELLITIMSSLAQEESRSISENVTWGRRKRFADGKVSLPYKHFLGYEKGEDGAPKIIESEAKIVRLIYRLFLEGKQYLQFQNI